MTDRKIRSTSTSTSPSSNTRPVTSTSRTTSSINLNDSAVNNSEPRPSKTKKNKTSSPTTTTSLSTAATATTPKHKRPQQKQSQSQRHSPSPLHTPSSRRYKRQELSHRPSQQTLLDNDSTHINDDDDNHNSPSTIPKPSTYGNSHNNWISEVRLDNTHNTPPILPPLTIPQGVYMSDTSYSTLSSSPRSQQQQKQEGSTRSRSGSVAPASPSPPPSTSTSTGHSEEGGLPKVIALKQTEVRAWYLQNATYCGYGWVSAVLLVPLLVQDLAAMNGVETANLSQRCDTTKPDYDCVMHIFGNHYLDPGTISLYVSSFSAVISFVISLSVAAIADHGAYRKRLLAAFAIMGCMTSVSFFMIQAPSLFWMAPVLSPLGWACYNASSVFTNAFLPIYVRVHPKVLEAQDRVEAHLTLQEMDEKNRDLFRSNHRMSSQFYPYGSSITSPTGTSYSALVAEQRKVEEQVSNDLSAWCAGAGIVGTVIVQGFCIGISIGMNESLLSLQIAIAFTGVWWLAWTMAVLPWLNARPGPPLPEGQNWITYSWRKNFNTIKAMRQLSQITKFILAWFLLSDGINTVTALLFVITYQELKFTHTESLMMTIALSSVSFVGTYLFLMIRRFWKLSTKFMVMLTLGLYTTLAAYFVITPYFSSMYGLRQEWEAWVSVVYIGLIISTFFGVARVMMAELCPEGEENEWFSLFQLADKGSSWIGPFATGAIQALTGEFRPGFWFPLSLFIVGGALLFTVDMNKGKDEAARYRADQEAKRRLLASIPPITITHAGESPFLARSILLDL